MRRGEIRGTPSRPPILRLTRDDVIAALGEVIVAPATRTIRGIASEVVLTREDGMPAHCALNFDHVALARRDRIGPLVATLRDDRWAEVEHALLVACGFRPSRGG